MLKTNLVLLYLRCEPCAHNSASPSSLENYHHEHVKEKNGPFSSIQKLSTFKSDLMPLQII